MEKQLPCGGCQGEIQTTGARRQKGKRRPRRLSKKEKFHFCATLTSGEDAASPLLGHGVQGGRCFALYAKNGVDKVCDIAVSETDGGQRITCHLPSGEEVPVGTYKVLLASHGLDPTDPLTVVTLTVTLVEAVPGADREVAGRAVEGRDAERQGQPRRAGACSLHVGVHDDGRRFSAPPPHTNRRGSPLRR